MVGTSMLPYRVQYYYYYYYREKLVKTTLEKNSGLALPSNCTRLIVKMKNCTFEKIRASASKQLCSLENL